MENLIVTLNTDTLSPPVAGNSLWENRAGCYSCALDPDAPEVSVCVQAYNQLEKTRLCVECILKYTQDVDYELILVDNGSTDGTLEFFQSVQHPRKTILRVTKNLEAGYPASWIIHNFKGKYLAAIANDLYVSENWLSNLLACFEADERVGMVVPMCMNTSNLQQPMGFTCGSFEEFQQKAAIFNQPDPNKWQERIRLITLGTVYKRQLLDEMGYIDKGYQHNFVDDDLAFRVRRAGYKAMLCGDTVIYHDHHYVYQTQQEVDKFNRDLQSDRKLFQTKYHGIDAWDDVNNFESNLISLLNTKTFAKKGDLKILCVDGRCGTPLLEIRNRLRGAGIGADTVSYAFTTNAKYYPDLITVADHVFCDRIEFVQEPFASSKMDIILLGEPLNNYPQPIRLMRNLYDLLEAGGTLLFKVKNTENMESLLRMFGVLVQSDGEMTVQLADEDVRACLAILGATNYNCIRELGYLSEENENALSQLVQMNDQEFQMFKQRLLLEQTLYCVSK